jgi:carbon-monoxide dehydrogenase large subunit
MKTGTKTATANEAASVTAGSGMKWVGRAIRRLEDPALVRGRGQFTADLPATHHVRFVRSPVAAGRLVRISAPDGVRLIRAADLAARPIRPMLHKFNYRPIEQPILAHDVVRFVGEPIAAVFACTAAQAEDAADHVEIEFAELPAVRDTGDALSPDAPIVHELGNTIVDARFTTSEFERTFGAAGRRVRLVVQSHRQNATPLETRAAHAAFDCASGRVTLTCTTQMPHLTRTAIADILGFAESDLRVVAPDVGGGFGQKMSLAAEYVVLVFLARRLQDSVAWVEDRRENLIAGFHSRDQRLELEGAFDADGRIVALSADVLANVGAYSCFPTTCGVEPLMAMAELPGPYDLRAYSCRARAIATHTCTMAPYRGVARPVITLAIELLMDKAAAAFGLSPVEIRKRNLVRHFPYTSATGLVFDEGSYVETLDIAAAQIDLLNFARARTRHARPAVFSGSGSPLSRSAPATAVRFLPPAAWKSRLDGRPWRSSWIRQAKSRPASAQARTARAWRQRLRKSSLTRSASCLPMCASCTATPTARPMAGAHSPAARLSSPAAPLCWRRKKSARSSSRLPAMCWRPRATISCCKTARPESPVRIGPFQ